MYIVKQDYYGRISTDLLNRIITEGADDGTDLLKACSKIAEDTVNSHAGVLYDLTGELIKTADDRNHLIVFWCLNIATYNIYQRIDDEEVPQKVIKNFDDTMEDLVKVSKGSYPLNLPAKQSADTGGSGSDENTLTDGAGLRRMGSQAKRSHNV